MARAVDFSTAKVLAFDYGTKRIGVAIGQMITKTATPLATLRINHAKPDMQAIKSLIATWKPQILVVGIPVNMDGSEQDITHKARYFAKRLHNVFKLPVYEEDERLTTKEAREQVFTEGGYKALQETQIDSVAAKIILESWMHSL